MKNVERMKLISNFRSQVALTKEEISKLKLALQRAQSSEKKMQFKIKI